MALEKCAKCSRLMVTAKRWFRCTKCKAWFCLSCMDRFCYYCRGAVQETTTNA